MTVSFKKFTQFLAASEGVQSPDQLDEIWSSIFAKKQADKDDADGKDKNKVLTAKERLEKKKKEEEERKAGLRKKRDDEWAKAKHQAERGTAASLRPSYDRTSRDDYALHRNEAQAAARNQVIEGKESYSDASYWKDDAKAAGFKIKKLLGSMEDGDQTWGAFDGDKKVGEFTEEETGRGGWLIS